VDVGWLGTAVENSCGNSNYSSGISAMCEILLACMPGLCYLPSVCHA
jgi:hypothetical protein